MIEHINDGSVVETIAIQQRVLCSAALLNMLLGRCPIDLSVISGGGSLDDQLTGKKCGRSINDHSAGGKVV